MKTKEELNTLRNEVEALNKKLAELNAEELEQVVGGLSKLPPFNPGEKYVMGSPFTIPDIPDSGSYNFHIYK